jgi:asparagine synthase (glutamine-hydrolysing)
MIDNQLDRVFVNVIDKHAMKWQSRKSPFVEVHCLGYIFVDGKLFVGDSFARYIFEKASEDEFSEESWRGILEESNGSFAIIIIRGLGVYAAADHIRSWPLFYALDKGRRFIIGNDARSVRKIIGCNKVDQDSAIEFYYCGYVTGGNTLFEGLHQLQAGEYVVAELGTDIQIKQCRYFEYKPELSVSLDNHDLLDNFDQVLLEAIGKILKTCSSRPIVVPLSGGLDSRLVALTLKRLGYNNVICYTYGLQNNRDSRKSKEIASRLGYKWIYVSYTRAMWYKLYRSQGFKAYLRCADNYSSIPHIDEWPALYKATSANLFPEAAIFFPGHTGDFISGGHLKYVIESTAKSTSERLVRSIVDKHYSLWPDRGDRDRVEKRITDRFSGFRIKNGYDLASLYEYWEWQGRQSKFIVNAVRVYDFFGYEWRIPLWEKSVVAFWANVPLDLKIRKRLYVDYLKDSRNLDFYDDIAKVPQRDVDSFKRKLFSNGGEQAILTRRVYRCLQAYKKKILSYYRDPLGQQGIYGFLYMALLNIRKRNVNSVLVRDYLKYLVDEVDVM